jgi:hydroxymethylglutaryl-CoA lyase
LQNEPELIDTATKVELIARLGKAGLQTIEATSFVSPKWVPQMADNAAVLRAIERRPGVAYPVLTPNLQGFEAALAAGAREVAMFSFSFRILLAKRTSIAPLAESLARFEPVMLAAKQAGVPVRGYVSCALGCPYEGRYPAGGGRSRGRRAL